MRKLLFLLGFIHSFAFSQVSITIDLENEGRTYSKYIFGKNNSLSDDPDNPLSESEWTRLRDSGITIFRENGGNNSTKYNWTRKISSHPDWYNNVYAHDWDYAAKSLQEHLPDRMGIFGLQLIGKAAKTNAYNFNEWEYNRAQWWEGVHQNLAGGGIVDETGGALALVEGDPDLYLMNWPADSTVGIFSHWFDEEGIGLDKDQFIFWSMDNEPSIWNGTHDDIATDEETAEDYFQKYIAVAKAAREKYPEVKLMGPIFANEWQWYNWHNKRINYKGDNYSSLEYFILRIGEEQKATGIRLLDILTIHYYPGNENVEDVVQFHRVYFDQDYEYPNANGVKTVNGGWDETINKEYIFKRALDWMEQHIGVGHNIGLGVTETGVTINDPNGVAVWYASTLGEFMKQNVEVFTPWSWQPSMWEVVNLFTEFSEMHYYDAVSSNEELISAYTTADVELENITVFLVNRSVNKDQNVTINLKGKYIDLGSIDAYQLSDLPSTETFYSNAQNALTEQMVAGYYRSVILDMPPLSVVAITFNTSENIPTGLNTIEKTTQINVYPNPVSDGVINIKFKGSSLDFFKLISIDGRIIKAIKNPGNTMELGDISPGLYIIQIGTVEGLIKSKLVIK